MTKENLIKLHKHYSFLADGNFTERDFDQEIIADKPENAGNIIMGKITAQRRQLIISDAKRHLTDIESKYPELLGPVQEETIEPENTKSKVRVKK